MPGLPKSDYDIRFDRFSLFHHDFFVISFFSITISWATVPITVPITISIASWSASVNAATIATIVARTAVLSRNCADHHTDQGHKEDFKVHR